MRSNAARHIGEKACNFSRKRRLIQLQKAQEGFYLDKPSNIVDEVLILAAVCHHSRHLAKYR